MKILIIGSSGFLGSSILKILIEKEQDFNCGVRRLSGRPNEVLVDLNNLTQIKESILKIKPNLIINAAGVFSTNFHESLTVNVLGTYNLLEAVRTTGLSSRVLLIGSAAEYGRPMDENPVTEESPLNPISEYGLTKKEQTEMMNFFFRRYSQDIVMARVFNTYANIDESQCSTRLLPGNLQSQAKDFSKSKLSQIKLGYLEEFRDFIHVSKAASDILFLSTHGTAGEVYNIGSGVPTKTFDFVKKFFKENSIPIDILNFSKEKPTIGLSSIFANIEKINLLKKERSY